ncbi:hypothetical protein MKW98_024026, partial [Papaver atlanticum]
CHEKEKGFGRKIDVPETQIKVLLILPLSGEDVNPTRLQSALQALNCDHRFDAVTLSAEVVAEKPNLSIFLKASDLPEVKPEDVLHIADDRRNDLWGARDADCDSWLWG